MIQAVKEEAVLMNTSLRWFRKRLPEAEANQNVVAFPSQDKAGQQADYDYAEAC